MTNLATPKWAVNLYSTMLAGGIDHERAVATIREEMEAVGHSEPEPDARLQRSAEENMGDIRRAIELGKLAARARRAPVVFRMAHSAGRQVRRAARQVRRAVRRMTRAGPEDGPPPNPHSGDLASPRLDAGREVKS